MNKDYQILAVILIGTLGFITAFSLQGSPILTIGASAPSDGDTGGGDTGGGYGGDTGGGYGGDTGGEEAGGYGSVAYL